MTAASPLYGKRGKESFGPVDVLVNNGGITNDANVEKNGSRDQWPQVINVN